MQTNLNGDKKQFGSTYFQFVEADGVEKSLYCYFRSRGKKCVLSAEYYLLCSYVIVYLTDLAEGRLKYLHYLC